MCKWIDPNNKESLGELLMVLSNRKHWPAGNNKPGDLAIDCVPKIHTCMGLMLHAPVTHYSDGEWKIIPLSPIPNDKEWSDVVGFDPMEDFSPVSIEDSYILKIWARSGKALPSEIPRPPYPHDPSWTICQSVFSLY